MKSANELPNDTWEAHMNVARRLILQVHENGEFSSDAEGAVLIALAHATIAQAGAMNRIADSLERLAACVGGPEGSPKFWTAQAD